MKTIRLNEKAIKAVSFRVGQVRRDLSTITAEMNRPWTPRLYRPTLRDHRT